MADFNSKYSGEQVEQLLDMVAGGNAGGGGGGIAVETDPIFSASPAANITEGQISDWNNAVNEITDIAEIREGASKGATALQYYVTAFDFGDLNGGQDLFQEEVDKANLVAAIRANKLILMPHDKTIPEIGSLLLSCFVEDFLYIDFIYGRQVFHVETDVYNPDIYASEITISTYALHDDVGGKQDTLVSGENIKTVNGESLLGSGDIIISGGSGEQGPQGEKGDKGDTGVGVQSVAQTTTSNADGGSNVVTVTLTDGTKSTFTIKNGSKGSVGEQGPKGDKGDKGDTGAAGTNGANGKNGADGATFTPSVDSAGNLSWSNNKGLANPPTVNIKGPKGDSGEGGGGGTGGSEIESVIEYMDMTNLVVEEMLPNRKYYLYLEVYKEDGSITIGNFQDFGDLESTNISEYYAIITIASASEGGDDTPNVSLGLPDVDIRWANGVPLLLNPESTYELSIMCVNSYGDKLYNAVITEFVI